MLPALLTFLHLHLSVQVASPTSTSSLHLLFTTKTKTPSKILYCFHALELPFCIAASVIPEPWPCCLKTGLHCHLTKSEVHQKLLSQLLKPVFLRFPERGDQLVSQVCAVTEMVTVFVESTFIRGARKFRTHLAGFSLSCGPLDTCENHQLTSWSVFVMKVWPKIFLTRRLILDSNNMLHLLDVGFVFGFFPLLFRHLLFSLTLLLISWTLVQVLWLWKQSSFVWCLAALAALLAWCVCFAGTDSLQQSCPGCWDV